MSIFIKNSDTCMQELTEGATSDTLSAGRGSHSLTCRYHNSFCWLRLFGLSDPELNITFLPITVKDLIQNHHRPHDNHAHEYRHVLPVVIDGVHLVHGRYSAHFARPRVVPRGFDGTLPIWDVAHSATPCRSVKPCSLAA